LQARLARRLPALLGEVFVEAGIATASGLFVPDVAWASLEFMATHGDETPFTQAPELCIEVASPSNSMKELNVKVAADLATGGVEAWVVFPQTRRFEFYGQEGRIEQTSFSIDLTGLFD
jgi:Uma2 family endonuclease